MTAVTDPFEGSYRRCEICGFKYQHSDLRKNWKGQVVCKHDYEPRHPMELYQARMPRVRPQVMGKGDGYHVDYATSSLKFIASLTSDNVGGESLIYSIATGGGYVFSSGDIIQYDIYRDVADPTADYTLSQGGIDLTTVEGHVLNTLTCVDEDNYTALAGPSVTRNGQRWYTRRLEIPTEIVGETLQYFRLACYGQYNGRTSTLTNYYKNIMILDDEYNVSKIVWVSGNPTITTLVQALGYNSAASSITATEPPL